MTKQWTDLALAIDIHVLSANYFLILLCQQIRDIFEVFYLLGQFFEVCMLSLKTHTPASDQRVELQNLTWNVHEKVLFGYNGGIRECSFEK